MTKKTALSLAGLTIHFSPIAYKTALFIPSSASIENPPADITVLPFTLSQKPKMIELEELSSFSLYAPSLLSLWAICAKQENPTLIKAVFSDNALSRFSMRIFKYQLLFERFRLGSDAESLIARNILHQNGLDKFMPNITIQQWLTWLEKSLKTPHLPLPLVL